MPPARRRRATWRIRRPMIYGALVESDQPLFESCIARSVLAPRKRLRENRCPARAPIRLLQVAFEERGQLGEWNEVDPVIEIHVSGIWNDEQLFRLGGSLVGILAELA